MKREKVSLGKEIRKTTRNASSSDFRGRIQREKQSAMESGVRRTETVFVQGLFKDCSSRAKANDTCSV